MNNNQPERQVRKIESITSTCQVVANEAISAATLKGWLTDKAAEHTLDYLLAQADDGVIWGRFDWPPAENVPANPHLITAQEVFSTVDNFPTLNFDTFQQARLFSECKEVMLWRVDNKWHYRVITDSSGTETDYYDEKQVLWGDSYIDQQKGFTRVNENELGREHAVPLTVPRTMFGKDKRPLRLVVRHYLKQDENSGLLKVTLSRLVKLEPEVK